MDLILFFLTCPGSVVPDTDDNLLLGADEVLFGAENLVF
jgi:hypothetical protein